jgi:hypothetical protein
LLVMPQGTPLETTPTLSTVSLDASSTNAHNYYKYVTVQKTGGVEIIGLAPSVETKPRVEQEREHDGGSGGGGGGVGGAKAGAVGARAGGTGGAGPIGGEAVPAFHARSASCRSPSVSVQRPKLSRQ